MIAINTQILSRENQFITFFNVMIRIFLILKYLKHHPDNQAFTKAHHVTMASDIVSNFNKLLKYGDDALKYKNEESIRLEIVILKLHVLSDIILQD